MGRHRVWGAQNRNNVMPVAEVRDAMPRPPIDCYCTWNRFPDTYRDHWKRTGRVAAYSGPSYADFIPFDFDDQQDLGRALEQVRNFLRVLEVTYEVDDGPRCFFSGCKGFHVLLPAVLFGGWPPSSHLAGQLKEMAKIMADGIETADLAVYDQNRLLRMPNTRHGKSGLWKIPLHTHELLTLSSEDIKAQAEQGPREFEHPPWDDFEATAPCTSLMKQVMSTNARKPSKPVSLFPRGLREGDGRDNQAFYIARYCRDHTIEREDTMEILRMWDQLQCDALGETVLEQKIRSVFSNTIKGNQATIDPEQIKTPAELIAEYSTYIDKLKRGKVTLGLPQIDARLRGIAPGEVVTIIAKSGVGKTAVLQNILRHIALSQDAFTLFCSLEQPLPQVFERYAQMATSATGEMVEKQWDDPNEKDRIAQSVLNDLTHDRTLTCGVPGLRLDQLDQALDAAESKVGHQVNVLAVDYLGLLNTSDLDNNLYGQVSRAARELKNLAKRRDISVICLCQVSRAQGDDGSKPLTLFSARESGAIEESADFLLGLYRPDLKGEDEIITVQILKNRKGQDGVEFSYTFDKKSLRVLQH